MERNLHYFKDCDRLRLDGDDIQTTRAQTIEDVTCGTCKHRICRVIVDADWSRLNREDMDFIRRAALVLCGIRDSVYTI